MINSVLYTSHSSVQKIDGRYIVDNYFSTLKWGSNENILDVGTGDGFVLFEYVLPRIPSNFQKLVAMDIDDDMLKHVRVRCKNHSRIEPFQMDITTLHLPTQFRSHYDHVFSFYCLQLVKEQRQLFQNLFDMMKPGGEMLLSSIANHVVFDVYEKLSKFQKWEQFMTNYRDFGPYHFSANPVYEVEQILRDIGFVKYNCDLLNGSKTHEIEEFWLWASTVNPFIKKIPLEQMDQYKEDYMNQVRKHPKVVIENKNGEEHKICVKYQFLVIFARKPLLEI